MFAAPPKVQAGPPQYQTASNDPATHRPESLQQPARLPGDGVPDGSGVGAVGSNSVLAIPLTMYAT